jgi:serpin B
LLDFSTDAARVSINNWVAQRTEGKIPSLFAPDSLLGARLAIVNTLYFNAAWEAVFDASKTKAEAFHLLDGTTVDAPMMRNSKLSSARAALVDGVQLLELPYDGGDVSLLVVAPATGTFTTFSKDLTASRLDDLTSKLTSGLLDVRLPKFKFDSRLELGDDLKALGMASAFAPGTADFSRMAPDLFIGVAVHQAVIVLDESGTEAAAATGFGVFTTSLPPEPTEVVINRPFLFFIRDAKTGLVLFSGRVVDPR